MYCTFCGAKQRQGASYCFQCGEPMGIRTSQPQVKIPNEKSNLDNSVSEKSRQRIVLTSVLGIVLIALGAVALLENRTLSSQPYTPNNQAPKTDISNQDISPSNSTERKPEPPTEEEVCAEYGDLAAAALGYQCTPTANSVKEAVILAFTTYCEDPNQGALDETVWTVSSPVPVDGKYLVWAPTTVGITTMVVDVSSDESAFIYPYDSNTGEVLDRWRCKPPMRINYN